MDDRRSAARAPLSRNAAAALAAASRVLSAVPTVSATRPLCSASAGRSSPASRCQPSEYQRLVDDGAARQRASELAVWRRRHRESFAAVDGLAAAAAAREEEENAARRAHGRRGQSFDLPAGFFAGGRFPSDDRRIGGTGIRPSGAAVFLPATTAPTQPLSILTSHLPGRRGPDHPPSSVEAAIDDFMVQGRSSDDWLSVKSSWHQARGEYSRVH